jgi:hypothetical protein
MFDRNVGALLRELPAVIVPDTEWLAAVTRLQTPPMEPIRKAFDRDVERWLAAPSSLLKKRPPLGELRALLNLGPSMAIAWRLSGNFAVHRLFLQLTKHLLDDSWRTHLDEEILRSGWIATLAFYLDLNRTSLSDFELSSFAKAIADLAALQMERARSKPFGSLEPSRLLWNHSVVAMSGVGIAAGVLPFHPMADTWREAALVRAMGYLNYGLSSEGAAREGLLYCGFVLQFLGMFLRTLKNTGHFDYTNSATNPYLEKLRRIPSWYLASIFPRGSYLECLNNSTWTPTEPIRGLLMTCGDLSPQPVREVWDRLFGEAGNRTFGFNRVDMDRSTTGHALLWYPAGVAARAEAGKRTRFFCPDVGIFSESNSDPEFMSLFGFNSGKFRGGHDHSDNNAFTYYAHGVPLVIDGGASKDLREGSPCSSWGHSSVLIDGRGQRPAGRGFGCSGEILHAQTTDTHTTVIGDSRESYNIKDYNIVLRAIRYAVLSRCGIQYLLIFDDIQKDCEEHNYEFVFNSPASTIYSNKGANLFMTVEFEGLTATLEVRVLASDAVRLTWDDWQTKAPFVSVRRWRFLRRSVRPDFMFLFLPSVPDKPVGIEAKCSVSGDHAQVTLYAPDRAVLDTIDFRRGEDVRVQVTRTNWPAAGSADTELGVLKEPEVGHGEAEVYTRVQA